MSELSESDEWETPIDLYDMLCEKYKLYPTLDVAATFSNSKCRGFLTDAFCGSWKPNSLVNTVWCNPPNREIKKFVEKAEHEWRFSDLNIMMIIPANSMCTNYAQEFIYMKAEFHPINRRWCKFLFEGKSKDHARNGYFVVIWRKRSAD